MGKTQFLILAIVYCFMAVLFGITPVEPFFNKIILSTFCGFASVFSFYVFNRLRGVDNND